MPQGHCYSSQLGQATKPARKRIARMGPESVIVQEVVTMVGPERYGVVRTAFLAPPAFFGQQLADQGDHVGVTPKVLGLLKRSIRFLGHVA